MKEQLKELKRALTIVRILNRMGSIFVFAGLFGLLGMTGSLEQANMSIPTYIVTTALCLGMLALGVFLLHNLDGMQDNLKHKIWNLERKIRHEMRKRKEAEQLAYETEANIIRINRTA